MKVKVSDYIADFLVDNGIDTMFMITGGGAMHLDDSFGHKEGLHCVFNHNEQGCSVAAEGYTRQQISRSLRYQRSGRNECIDRCIGRMVRFHSNVHRVRPGKKRDDDMVYRCSGTSVRRSGISDRGKC